MAVVDTRTGTTFQDTHYDGGMQWFEDDAFWRTLYPYMFDEARWAAAEGEVEQLQRLSGVAQGAVLDLCCGPGRHAVPLARRGYSVTAVDRSPFLLAKAGERAAGAPIEFIAADMREFVREGWFDLAVSLFTSFGYGDTREQDCQVLRNVHASLKPGGVLVVDVFGKELLAAPWSSRNRRHRHADGSILFEHAEILAGWGRLRNHWVLVQGGDAHQFVFELNLYSGEELAAQLERAGYRGIELFGSLEGSPYDAAATRLVARARR